ncbi:PAS domain-containing sensor histidine kinase [Ekhidna sp.]|uniref:sensor histidine kinase n=1 Tax=Ekhidna sp. TaxID=2608089 RepID=UPI0032EAB6F0
MKSILKEINQAGLEGLVDPLDYRRVLFVNNLSLISCAVSLIVTVIVFAEGLFPQFVVTLAGGILFLLVVYFNHLRKFILARTYFLGLSVVILFSASWVAYGQNRFNETENILIGFMAVNYLLYDGKFRYVGFLLIYGVLIWLKFIKQSFLGDSYDLNFFLGIQNVSILCLLIFLFADAFRKSLLKSFVRLKEKDELLYAMIDTVPLFIALVDKELKYRMVNINYEKAFGMDREKIIGSYVRDVLPENILDVHIPLIQKALGGESPEFLELTEMPDGGTFYAGGKYMPVHSDDGEVIGVSVFVNDVTKLEVAKNKLKAANSTKDKLFSIIAHDIRGPLDLFEGLLNYSSEGSLPKAEFLKHQENVKEKLGSLKQTVNTLLEWARTQLDGVNTVPRSTDVKDIVRSNLNLYSEIIDQKNINVDVNIEPNTLAWIDSNHLKVGMRNMIHNSLKFTEDGGHLAINSFRVGDKIIAELKDTGVGMSKDKIESILKKELQNSTGGTAGELGTGLGLSLSLELLEKNNCKVQIESVPGEGTQITIEMQANVNGH